MEGARSTGTMENIHSRVQTGLTNTGPLQIWKTYITDRTNGVLEEQILLSIPKNHPGFRQTKVMAWNESQ